MKNSPYWRISANKCESNNWIKKKNLSFHNSHWTDGPGITKMWQPDVPCLTTRNEKQTAVKHPCQKSKPDPTTSLELNARCKGRMISVTLRGGKQSPNVGVSWTSGLASSACESHGKRVSEGEGEGTWRDAGLVWTLIQTNWLSKDIFETNGEIWIWTGCQRIARKPSADLMWITALCETEEHDLRPGFGVKCPRQEEGRIRPSRVAKSDP